MSNPQPSPSGPAPSVARTPEEILDLLPDAVVVVEPGPMIGWLNRSAEQLLVVSRSLAVGRPCAEIVDIRDPHGQSVWASVPLGRRLPVSRGTPERDYELVRPGGEHVPLSVRCAYDRDERHVVRRIVCTMRDARARKGMDLRTVEVISTVSHEIRSPLTSIKGFTKTLLDRWERFDDDMKREMLGAVNTDADRVTRLLGELLDISRLEAGRLKLRPRPVDIPELAETLVGKLGPEWTNHTLEVSFPGGFPPVLADQDKVQQVLTNLVENALKYTEGGTVRLTGRVDGNRVAVAVSDEGEGIPSSQLPRLFRKFFRRERAGSPTGTGLGLYICRGLIEAHGGEISATSTIGAGTTFTFTLPLRPEVDVP